jgi:predicted house-cleaning noncanonical NTP pyrophosphatase (MazG superfamily)
MQRRKFKQNKLWRDKTIENLERIGSKIHWTRLDTEQFIEQLKNKLLEEADEVCRAKDKESLIEELADLLEVVCSLCEIHGFTLDDVFHIQDKKRQERGGFQDRKFVTFAEHPVGSYFEKYCLNDPDKYPEIFGDSYEK